METSLIEGCDYAQIKQICKCRPIPEHLRQEVWPICLAVDGKSDTMNSFDQLYDLPEQSLIRQDCQALVGKCSYHVTAILLNIDKALFWRSSISMKALLQL